MVYHKLTVKPDLSGEMVEIPSGLDAGLPPSNTDFFFADLI